MTGLLEELNRPEFFGPHEEKPDKVLPKFIQVDVNADIDVIVNKVITNIDLFYPKVNDTEHILTNNNDYDTAFFKCEFGN